MSKNKNKGKVENEEKTMILIYIALILSIIACFISIVKPMLGKNKSTYDVSMMNSVSVIETLDMIEDEETFVLYIGRKNCEICVDLLPTLQQAQNDLEFVTQYMDITKIDRQSKVWKNLVEKFDIETTQSLKADGTGELVTETFGYFLDTKGFTPCVMIFKDGEQKAGFFGDRAFADYKAWLKDYGF